MAALKNIAPAAMPTRPAVAMTIIPAMNSTSGMP